MAALAKGVQRPEIPGRIRSAPQKDSTIVFQGGLVMLDTSNRAQPAAPSVPGAIVGGVALPRDFAIDRYDNTVVGHADGFLFVRFEEGAHGLLNDGTNPILSTTQPGTPVFAVDDQTVSLSSNGGLRPVAGRLIKLDAGVTGVTGGPVVVDISEALNAQIYQQMLGVQAVGAVLAITANVITPAYGIHHVGAGLIKTITVPASFANSGGTVDLWPDAAFTYDATGNILLPAGGGTAVVNRIMTFTWDPVAAKWAPSY